MTATKKCLNEWTAPVEALGSGKQSILIRSYNSYEDSEFLLYPTHSYVNKKIVPDCFRDEYKKFVDENLLPEREDEKTLVKYYAKVVKTSEKSKSRIGALNKFHIWTREHVVSHMNNKKPYVWLLRVYKLDTPIMLKRSKGMVWATVDKDVELKGTPVISNEDFKNIEDSIK